MLRGPALAVLSLLAGCMPGLDPPAYDGSPLPPGCHARVAVGTVAAEAENATGAPDGKVVIIEAFTVLELTTGREIRDSDGADFELVGEVLSGSAAAGTGCPVVTDTAGTILVKVLTEGLWRLAGVWRGGGGGDSGAPASQRFDLGCAGARQSVTIRLEALAQARARLDAVRGLSCVE